MRGTCRPEASASRRESPPEAVLRYAGDFLPSWAGAISIDLMPAVLIFIMVIVEGSIRRHSGTDLDTETMTAADVIRGAEIYRQMEARFAGLARPPEEAAPQAPAAATSLPPAEPRTPENIARLNPKA